MAAAQGPWVGASARRERFMRRLTPVGMACIGLEWRQMPIFGARRAERAGEKNPYWTAAPLVPPKIEGSAVRH